MLWTISMLLSDWGNRNKNVCTRKWNRFSTTNRIWPFLDLSGVSLSPYCLPREWELWETRLSLFHVILRDSYLYLGSNKEIMGTVGTSEILEFGQLVNSCWSRFLPVTCLSHPVHWVLPLGLWRLMPEIKLCNYSEIFDPYWVNSYAIFF